MHRNMFNEPKPATVEELVEAVDEYDLDVFSSSAEIQEPDPDNVGTIYEGWTAEISGPNLDGDEDINFETAGFPTRERLEETLKSVGIDIA